MQVRYRTSFLDCPLGLDVSAFIIPSTGRLLNLMKGRKSFEQLVTAGKQLKVQIMHMLNL